MQFVFFEAEDWQEAPLRSTFPEHELIFTKEKLNTETAAAYPKAEMVSVFINSRVSAEVIAALPQLKLITTRSTGFDHIDTATAKKHKIYVANVPHYGENTVAEHTFALILALSRKIFQTYERTEKLNFGIDPSIQGFDLKDKTIGIYGLGSIGYYVAKIAHGFSMNIVAYKRTPDPALTEEFGVQFVSTVEELLMRSDVITLHCPLVEDTKYLINHDTIRFMKHGSILINTSRGGLIDTDALILALEEGRLAGAGLDVFEGENALADPESVLENTQQDMQNMRSVLENHVLVARDDVIMTPHNAFNSKEAVERILQTTIENVHRFFVGNSQNIVNADW